MPASAPAELTREQRFDMAKTAAAQRAATTLSAVDSASADFSGAAGATTRRIGTRTFTLAAGTWTDARYVSTTRTVRVKPYSSAYFALLERIEDLRAPLSLVGPGSNAGIVVAGRAVAVAFVEDGVETLSARDVAATEAAW
jgi:hypothetical protein